MAMAVAENAITVPAQRTPRRQANLGLAGLAGGLILLAGLGLVFAALPVFWHDVLPTGKMNEFLSSALLLILGIGAATGVAYVWYTLDRAWSVPGLRAASIIDAVMLFVVAWCSPSVTPARSRRRPRSSSPCCSARFCWPA